MDGSTRWGSFLEEWFIIEGSSGSCRGRELEFAGQDNRRLQYRIDSGSMTGALMAHSISRREGGSLAMSCDLQSLCWCRVTKPLLTARGKRLKVHLEFDGITLHYTDFKSFLQYSLWV
jgi:hypothetical protein